MPTKLNQDQISGLPEDLNSLESFISIEDSIGDAIDVSQDAALENFNETLQEQIDFLKLTLGSLIFPRETYIYQDGSTLYASVPTEFTVPATVSYVWEFADDAEARNFMTIDGANGSFYSPTEDFPYIYRVTVTFTSALGINQALSNEVVYTPQSSGSGPR